MMLQLARVTREQIGYDIPLSTFRRWVSTGVFPGVKVGGRWFIDDAQLTAFRSGEWIPMDTSKVWRDLRDLARRRGLIGNSPEHDPRQTELPLTEAPTIPAGALAPEPGDLRDPLGEAAPAWVADLARRVANGEGLAHDESGRLLRWMEGSDVEPPAPKPVPQLSFDALADVLSTAPERIRLIGEAYLAGDDISDAERARFLEWARGVTL